MEFFTSDRSTFSRQTRLSSRKKKGDDGLFVWSAIILILTALIVFSWIFCMYVFGNPEKAFNYNLLVKMEKLEPLKDYPNTGAPTGKYFKPQELYATYHDKSEKKLRAKSGILRREFITNFNQVLQVSYIRGNFIVYNVRELGPDDVFPSGLAVRGQCEDYPNVVIEFVYPADKLPERHYDLKVNNLLEVGGSKTCAAIINIAKFGEDKLLFTAVPIIYGPLQTPAGTTIVTAPPERLNLFGRLPITDDTFSGPEPPPLKAEEIPATTAAAEAPGS
ncbi:MAG: hypothetical protein ACI8UO_005888 [Verrucomicrobiales bacterium]|jgi:hypothetical protein